MRSKDETALQALMDQYGDYLLRMAYLLLKDAHLAEEAVQDTFIAAFTKIEQLRDANQLKSWLTRIAINHCRMKQRSWSWRKLIPFARMEDIYMERVVPDLEEQFLEQARNHRLGESVQRLDYKYREAITLYYYAEMSIQEIVQYTSLNENTIKSRLARGRELLRKQWEKEGL
ncbi:sigma-70 family RNA polymerase sigma factor [Paenibacillus sp. GXUN7292]|uniref:sigma-70 family RNA polymerase sigma factor n=1 Tax=Paenibacillus sp. GXUN7292 TaxID=3422499 RepID=UPI003D7C65DA